MENSEEVVKELKETLDFLKKDIATKEGARDSVLSRIKGEFKVGSLEEARSLRDDMEKESGTKKKQREDLLAIAKEKLRAYRD